MIATSTSVAPLTAKDIFTPPPALEAVGLAVKPAGPANASDPINPSATTSAVAKLFGMACLLLMPGIGWS